MQGDLRCSSFAKNHGSGPTISQWAGLTQSAYSKLPQEGSRRKD
ncbi:hypothetical protein C943_01130 [Mariniradius saccharolyticus AK6]|uniref:Uncharacterized protein n=1 Tax=Mariniradius saccharolyticus AK6 TaxID=1239962 RepID=M7XCW6_9BACT|nr:hypothetical protein C943_01130 [Mariniradius saccharolyticus AK6]